LKTRCEASAARRQAQNVGSESDENLDDSEVTLM